MKKKVLIVAMSVALVAGLASCASTSGVEGKQVEVVDETTAVVEDEVSTEAEAEEVESEEEIVSTEIAEEETSVEAEEVTEAVDEAPVAEE